MSNYTTIVNDIKSKLENGDYGVGDKLPSEQEMSKEYGLSRPTVRKALSILMNDGIVTSIPGKGYYVSEVDYSIFHLPYLTYSTQGIEKYMNVLKVSTQQISAGAEIKEKLDMSEDGRVTKVSSRITIIEELVGVSYKYIVEGSDLSFERKELTITSMPANSMVAEALGVKKGTPLLVAEEVLFDKDGQRSEYEIIYFNGEKYRMECR